MRPIPKRLLIHNINHIRNDKDPFGSPTEVFNNPVKRVRIEPTQKRILGKENTEVQLNSLVFYDCINSNPKGIEFKIEDVIEFNGTNYTVKAIEPLYDESKLHHYEIGLV